MHAEVPPCPTSDLLPQPSPIMVMQPRRSANSVDYGLARPTVSGHQASTASPLMPRSALPLHAMVRLESVSAGSRSSLRLTNSIQQAAVQVHLVVQDNAHAGSAAASSTRRSKLGISNCMPAGLPLVSTWHGADSPYAKAGPRAPMTV